MNYTDLFFGIAILIFPAAFYFILIFIGFKARLRKIWKSIVVDTTLITFLVFISIPFLNSLNTNGVEINTSQIAVVAIVWIFSPLVMALAYKVSINTSDAVP